MSTFNTIKFALNFNFNIIIIEHNFTNKQQCLTTKNKQITNQFKETVLFFSMLTSRKKKITEFKEKFERETPFEYSDAFDTPIVTRQARNVRRSTVILPFNGADVTRTLIDVNHWIDEHFDHEPSDQVQLYSRYIMKK